MADEKVEGSPIVVTLMFVEGFDGDSKMKNVSTDIRGEIVVIKEDCVGFESTIKQAGKKKRAKIRKRSKKRKMAPPFLGGATYDSLPSRDPGTILLTSTTTDEWRVFGHHVGGGTDARSESTPTDDVVSLLSYSF